MAKSILRAAAALALASSLGLGAANTAFAADEVNVAPGGTPQGPGIAVQGYDVVSYRDGNGPELGLSEYAVAHEGGTYLFASEANMKAFEADPERFVPAYGGFCAFGVAKGKKFNGDPLVYDIVDDRLFLNINGDVQTLWSKDAAPMIQDADTQWTTIRSTAASEL